MLRVTSVQTDFRCRACMADLRSNGIDLADHSDPALRVFVRHHRLYFDAMLGFEHSVPAIVKLIRAARLMDQLGA